MRGRCGDRLPTGTEIFKGLQQCRRKRSHHRETKYDFDSTTLYYFLNAHILFPWSIALENTH